MVDTNPAAMRLSALWEFFEWSDTGILNTYSSCTHLLTLCALQLPFIVMTLVHAWQWAALYFCFSFLHSLIIFLFPLCLISFRLFYFSLPFFILFFVEFPTTYDATIFSNLFPHVSKKEIVPSRWTRCIYRPRYNKRQCGRMRFDLSGKSDIETSTAAKEDGGSWDAKKALIKKLEAMVAMASFMGTSYGVFTHKEF